MMAVSALAVRSLRGPLSFARQPPGCTAVAACRQCSWARVPHSASNTRRRISSGFWISTGQQLLCFGAGVGLGIRAHSARQRQLGRCMPRLLCRAGMHSTAAATPPHEMILFRSATSPSVQATDASAGAWGGHTMVLFLQAHAEGVDGPLDLGESGAAVDRELEGAIQAFIEAEEFDAKEGTAKAMQVFGKGIKRVALVGLGNKAAAELDWRLAGASAATVLKSMRGGSVGLACVDGDRIQPLVEGLLLGLHSDQRFRGTKTPEKDKASKGPDSVELIGGSLSPDTTVVDVQKAQAVADGVIFARELVNGAPNIVTPPNLASAAEDLATQLGLTAEILDEAQCEELGMGSFLAVGRASNLPSKLIHLTYSPEGGASRKVGIVGKGLTFDSGGYNIKAGAGSMIEMMKMDMGGSAATLGAAAAIARLKPKDVEVHFVIATCENMISGNPGALRPGDIITAMDGTTIEVNNTDAEGRLTLADALLYCQGKGVTEVVDIATLTGACMVALGQGISGMWSNSDNLAGRLEEASKRAGEKLWRMPLEDTYFEGLKSDFADMKNTGPRFGGAITAALFLQKFVHKETQWAHLDIAGTAWAEKPKGVQPAAGGTGEMVRTLTALVVQS